MNRRKKLALLGVTLLALACVATIVAQAVYISQNYHKTVVVAGESHPRFSGDFLQTTKVDSSYPILARTYADTDIQLGMFNHPYGIPDEFSKKDVKYNITFKILSPSVLLPGETYSVKSNANGETKLFDSATKTVTFENQVLEGGHVSSIAYSIKVPETTIVEITAEPIDAGTALSTLYGKIQRVIVTDADKPVTIEWTGDFVYSSGLTPDQYAAFNYQISGSGVGTYKLTWDHRKLALDESFLSGVTFDKTVGAETTSVSFHVDSGSCEMYEVRFYKLSTDLTTWEKVNACIVTDGCYRAD